MPNTKAYIISAKRATTAPSREHDKKPSPLLGTSLERPIGKLPYRELTSFPTQKPSTSLTFTSALPPSPPPSPDRKDRLPVSCGLRSGNWRTGSPPLSPPVSPSRKQRLTSPPTPGDIILLPRDVSEGSIVLQHTAAGYYGKGGPLGHALVVLEVQHEYVIAAQCTAFSSGDGWDAKCRSRQWCWRYWPIGHDQHPNPKGLRVALARGEFSKKTYVNVAAPLVVEWAECAEWGRGRERTRMDRQGLAVVHDVVVRELRPGYLRGSSGSNGGVHEWMRRDHLGWLKTRLLPPDWQPDW